MVFTTMIMVSCKKIVIVLIFCAFRGATRYVLGAVDGGSWVGTCAANCKSTVITIRQSFPYHDIKNGEILITETVVSWLRKSSALLGYLTSTGDLPSKLRIFLRLQRPVEGLFF